MLALARIDADLSAAGIDGGPVAWLRDEIVAEVPEVDAEEARRLLVAAMTDAFAETFPGAPLWLADAVLVNSYRVDIVSASAPAGFFPTVLRNPNRQLQIDQARLQAKKWFRRLEEGRCGRPIADHHCLQCGVPSEIGSARTAAGTTDRLPMPDGITAGVTAGQEKLGEGQYGTTCITKTGAGRIAGRGVFSLSRRCDSHHPHRSPARSSTARHPARGRRRSRPPRRSSPACVRATCCGPCPAAGRTRRCPRPRG